MVERPELYILAGDGEVVMNGRHRFTQKKGFSTKIKIWIRGDKAKG